MSSEMSAVTLNSNNQESITVSQPDAVSVALGPSQSRSFVHSRNLVINNGQFNETQGNHNSLVIHINQGGPADPQSSSQPSNEIRPGNHIGPVQFSGQSSQVDHERDQSQASSQSQEIPSQKSNEIYERHLTLKGRGFPLWTPDPNRVRHLDYRRTGVRIGDVGIITRSGAFSFLFNICLPHNDPVNPRTLPENFAPISPPIEAADIENVKAFKNGEYLASASVKKLQTGTAISDIVFESSACEGAILTMPRGARSEDLENLATFREYAAANVADWYRFANGPRGREAKNGEVHLVVGFDKTSSWGIATFANQSHQNSCRLKFGPSERESATTYTWSENSGIADVRAGPDPEESDELRIDSDPPDLQFENQCLFVRTLNVTLADDVWADIHSGSGEIPVDPRNSQYPRVKNYSDSNHRPHSNNPSNGSNFSPSQGTQSGTQRRSEGVDIALDKNPPIFVSGPVESITRTSHPSKILNDVLLARFPSAKMVITHDGDWSCVAKYDTLPDPQEFVANILADHDIYQENDVVFLQPKNIINEISESTRFGHLGGMEDLEEVITCHRKALALQPLEHPDRSSSILATALYTRFGQLGRMKDLEEAITCHRQALALRPHGHPDRSSSLNNLANAVYTRFENLGGMEDLEEAIICHRKALALQSHEHPEHSSSLNNLANALYTRFKHLGEMKDLEEAIACHREALAIFPHRHPYRSSSLNNLANSVYTRFEQLGSLHDLDEAIACHREALAFFHHGHPGRSSSLNNLADALYTRFKYLGKMKDLEEAITCHREALALRPHGHPGRSSSLNNLANSVYTRFEHLGRLDDLEEPITCHREALALFPHGHPYRSSSLNNLANYVYTRFEQLGRLDDLEEAITCHRQALALRPHGHPYRSSSISNLANSLYTRFEQLGRLDDLEEAITCHREALALFPHGHPFRSSSLNNLANAMYTRFVLKLDDLEEAIACHREALGLRPHEQHPDYSSSLNNLANAVSTRFKQLRRMEDLGEAITCHHQALALRPHEHPNRSSSLIILANAVSTRFEQLGRLGDLEEAITCHHQALALRPDGHPDRSSSLINLANALYTRFKQSRSNDELLDAVKYLSEAKNILPTEHPLQSRVGTSLASIFLIQCDTVSKLDERRHMMTEAFELFEQAADHSPASAKDRFDAAVRWARNAHRHEHPSAVHAYTKSLTLLGRRLILAPTIESQQNLLATVPKALALDAASISIDRGEYKSAIELLEQGRAVLWSKLRGCRHPLDKLRTIDKELFDQFGTLTGQLECLAKSVESRLSASESSGPSFEVKLRQHRILSEKWDNVVDKIRQVDGFTDFLRTVPFTTLQTAAAEGPIIIVNVSQYRSDAIILQNVGDPIIVPLPESLPIILAELSFQFATACASYGKDSANLILPILRSLWNNIAFPVRTQLVALGVPDKSRIWWCPTSKLCGLPLHAAGMYSPKAPRPNSIPDCYISSYTQSLSALIKARSGLVTRTTNPNILVIAQPDQILPMVNEEIGHIRRLFSNADILAGRDANHDTVLSGLRSHSWVHFACHGHLSDHPFHSFFQLHDNSRLELVKLIPAQCPDAELAFLSACHSAEGDTLDEVVHLAAAMQFCGFRSVVGTLWEMENVDGCDVTKDFYQHMFRIPGAVPDFRDSAEALHMATREMRKRGLGLERWVKFVHVGA